MRNILLTLLFFIVSFFSCYSQGVVQTSHISNYSYSLLLHGKDPLKSSFATGFFIRKNKKLYLVTCFHVFTGLDNWSNLNKGPYDSIRLRYYDSRNQIKYLIINTSDKSFTPRNFLVDPDIYFFEIDNKLLSDAKIYSIEKFIKTPNQSNTSKSSQELFSYQYCDTKDGYIAQEVKRIINENSLSFDGKKIYSPSRLFIDMPEDNNALIPIQFERNNTFLDTSLVDIWQNLSNPKITANLLLVDTLDVQSILTKWSNSSFLDYKHTNDSLSNFNIFPGKGLDDTDLSILTRDTKIEDNTISLRWPRHDSSYLVSIIPYTLYQRDTSIFTRDFSLLSDKIDFQEKNIFSNSGINLFSIDKNSLKEADPLFNDYVGKTIPNYFNNISNETGGNKNILSKGIEDFVFFDQRNLFDTASKLTWDWDNSKVLPEANELQNTRYLSQKSFESPIVSFLPKRVLNIFSQIDFDSFSPVLYNAEVVDKRLNTGIDEILSEKYFITQPPSFGGGSGSPIFLNCKGTLKNGRNVEWIEFAGMQCANSYKKSEYSLSGELESFATIILKAEVIWQLFNELSK